MLKVLLKKRISALGLCAAVLFLPCLHGDEYRQVPEQERELARQVHQAREAYQASLERLRGYYVHVHNEENRGWAEAELTAYHLIVKAPYVLDMDLPSADLKPEVNDPKANRIFREALDWLSKRTFTDRGENYKRSELLFRRLIRDYPRSDKLDEACYYLGEIYSTKYFQQNRRAVAYYERVLLYDPNTNLDARLRAAQLYEKLGDTRRAVELYQEVLRREVDPTVTRDAKRRLEGLIGRGTSRAG
ncbi:MAG: tetratricopeptide repeat protein [Planctomycetia bacterium]